MGLNIVIYGLSITSSWGNGHATTYRALTKALARRGHRVVFLERDAAWYRAHCDMPQSPYAAVSLYGGIEDVPTRFGALTRDADLIVLGSYAPDGPTLAQWIAREARGVTAFYDIDTPVTLAALARGDCPYITPADIPLFDLYLSFTGGPTLRRIESLYGARRAEPLYCAVDPETHAPVATQTRWDLGYLGTYSADRQPTVERLLLEPARREPERRFVVGGPQYPAAAKWPANVAQLDHVPPHDHAGFYCAQRFTLNVTRADMIAAGYSPSVRLFEAAACGAPIISDMWAGLETFLAPGEEILIAETSEDVLAILRDTPDERRQAIGLAARRRILSAHTAEHRAQELEAFYGRARDAKRAAASAAV